MEVDNSEQYTEENENQVANDGTVPENNESSQASESTPPQQQPPPSPLLLLQPASVQSSPVFKTIIDYWEEQLDWLSLGDIFSFGETCIAFHRVVGKYFQWKYPALDAWNDDRDISFYADFVQYIQRMKVWDESTKHILSNVKELKYISFFEITLDRSYVKSIENVLAKVEEISFLCCDIEGHAYESFLKHCVNLKCLTIQDSDYMEDCLLQNYPKLQRLHLSYYDAFENDELNQFFKLNPNVRNLSINGKCILENQNDLINSDIQLDDLIIDCTYHNHSGMATVLKELHQRGFYKRLHAYVYPSPSKDQLLALNGLVTLYIYTKNVALPQLPNLKELGIEGNLTELRKEGFNVAEIPNLFINLVRLVIDETSVDDILPFIRHSRNLNEITIKCLKEKTLDTFSLNNERKKLQGARKVIIYVSEDVYLATKWTTRSINLDWIEMQRYHSRTFKDAHDLRSENIIY